MQGLWDELRAKAPELKIKEREQDAKERGRRLVFAIRPTRSAGPLNGPWIERAPGIKKGVRRRRNRHWTTSWWICVSMM